MPRIKRLNLDHWMTSKLFCEDTLKYSGYTEIAPIIGKPGRFRRHSFEWFELPDGRAFHCKDRTMSIQFELKCLQAAELNQRQIEAISAAVRERVASKAQRELLQYRYYAEQTRDTYRRARIHRNRVVTLIRTKS